MTTTHKPIKVLRAGTVTFVDGRMTLKGWMFDIGSRSPAGWEKAYRAEIFRVVGDYIASRGGIPAETDAPIDPGLEVVAARETKAFLQRISAPPLRLTTPKPRVGLLGAAALALLAVWGAWR